MSSSRSNDQLHEKAVELVRAVYGMADRMRNVNIDALNESRSPTLRYHAQYELPRALALLRDDTIGAQQVHVVGSEHR